MAIIFAEVIDVENCGNYL